MNFFVILPDQLFSREVDVRFIIEHDEIYLIEDPVMFSLRDDDMKKIMHEAFKSYYNMLKSATGGTKIKYVSRLKVMERGGSYVSKKEGGNGEREFDGCDANSFHSHKESPSFLEYFVGTNKQMNMWRPANHWIWGDRIREMTFNGLPINFHESPQFLLPFEEVRKYFHRGEGYSERTIIKNLCERFDVKYELPDSSPDDYPITYKFDYGYHPNDVESSKIIIEKFLSKYNSSKYNCPQIDYILGIGLITPFEVLELMRKNPGNVYAYQLFRREYFRIIYLANSDLMCKEKLHFGVAQPNNIQNVPGGLYTDKQVAEYMIKSSVDGVASWKSCLDILKKSSNLFPWSILPRSLGAAIDLNTIRGNIDRYRSCLAIPDKNSDWAKKNSKQLKEMKIEL